MQWSSGTRPTRRPEDCAHSSTPTTREVPVPRSRRPTLGASASSCSEPPATRARSASRVSTAPTPSEPGWGRPCWRP
ncbi:hypothetical protein [Ornithinimicrobium kibberense]|uniref:hypothetical protein n=1 Tax=Ornithinimicrobium kibberense TaxID=282060 RepID=UPI00361136F9